MRLTKNDDVPPALKTGKMDPMLPNSAGAPFHFVLSFYLGSGMAILVSAFSK